MDLIKEAFQKVRKDIDSLGEELLFLRKSLVETREKIGEIGEIINKLNQKIEFFNQKQVLGNSADDIQNTASSTHPSTHNMPFSPVKPQNLTISIGNEGVPTDKQTDKQTDRHMQNPPQIEQNSIKNAAELLDSLDNIKKEIRLKFKRITEQELLVFSAIYQLDEEHGFSDYKALSERLNLSESSIRDYVGRLIRKGIPVDKKRINNKTIQLSVSKDLKKIASLSTILQLRGL